MHNCIKSFKHRLSHEYRIQNTEYRMKTDLTKNNLSIFKQRAQRIDKRQNRYGFVVSLEKILHTES